MKKRSENFLEPELKPHVKKIKELLSLESRQSISKVRFYRNLMPKIFISLEIRIYLNKFNLFDCK